MQPSVIFLVSSIPIQKGYSSVIRKAVKVSRFDLQERRGPWPEDPVAMERALKLLKLKKENMVVVVVIWSSQTARIAYLFKLLSLF